MKAYVVVSTREPERMRDYLKGVPEVKEVHIVYGGYDLIAEVEAENVEELGKIVFREIRNRFPVEETITLIVAD